MKAIIAFSLFFFVTFLALKAQDPVIMTIDGKDIKKSEFLYVYKKNNNNPNDFSRKSVDDYMELFINYKLKVIEAEDLKLDTSASFKKELAGYRKQLAQPYLTSKDVIDQLVKEAYQRMQSDLRASHILIKLSPNASPKDTLAAYQKAISVRNRLLKGEDFSKVAKEVSQDPSTTDRKGNDGKTISGNGGELGYFTALDLVQEFENAAYNLKVGEISMPVRSQFGYHIIKVSDKKPALGKILVAHILVKVDPMAANDEKASAKSKIDAIYNRLKSGENFEDIAKNESDDKGSSVKGGMLPWLGAFRMSPEFILPVYNMQKGEYSQPVLTQYGWHIIKLIDRKPIAQFDEVKGELKQRVSKDQRAQNAKEQLIAQLKNEYKPSLDLKKVNELLSVLNDSLYKHTWKAEMASKFNKPLLNIEKSIYTQSDLASYIESRQNQISKGDDKAVFLKKTAIQFESDKLIEYEDSKLEEKYPEFKALMKEYRDGILLFDLMDRNVWTKAVKDTAGLRNYYEDTKRKYLNDEKAIVVVYTIKSEKNAASLFKVLNTNFQGVDKTIAKMNKKDTAAVIKEEMKLYNKDLVAMYNKVEWKQGVYGTFPKDGKFQIVVVEKINPKEPKPLNEVKGLVTAEYQNYLEEKWVKDLRAKHNWKVNKDVLESIYK